MTHYTTFNKNPVNILVNPMFLGENINIARYDIQKHHIFERLTEAQLSFYWTPQEICLSKDFIDFKKLTTNQKHIFLANLKYQILLDSVQGRSPSIAFLPITTSPEVENWITTWSFIETIHSKSYTHIIRSLIDNPESVFDNIVTEEAILLRAHSITEYYDKLIFITQVMYSQTPGTYRYHGQLIEVNDYTLRKQLYLALHAVNALEAIRFHVSFACNFAFAENKTMEGCAKIMRFIARDEALHYSSTSHMINIILSGLDGDPLMTKIAHSCTNEAQDIFMLVVSQEKQWAQYLFKDEALLGLNESLLCDYIDYLAYTSMKTVGLQYVIEAKTNPLGWIESYLKSDNVQVAPQEVELSSYLVGQIKSDITNDRFENMEL